MMMMMVCQDNNQHTTKTV